MTLAPRQLLSISLNVKLGGGGEIRTFIPTYVGAGGTICLLRRSSTATKAGRVHYISICSGSGVRWTSFSAKRRWKDSNLRNPYGFTAFRVRPIRPLWHISALQKKTP